jgi:hypothetical protein
MDMLIFIIMLGGLIWTIEPIAKELKRANDRNDRLDKEKIYGKDFFPKKEK